MSFDKKYDFILCEGLNSSEFIALFDTDINLEIAKNLNIPFIGVTNGSSQNSHEIQQEIKIAYYTILSVTYDSYETSRQVGQIPVEITPDNDRKIALALGHFEAKIDTESLIKQLEISCS